MSANTPEQKFAEYIERLVKRRDYLSVRIEKAKADGRDLSYDKAEFKALDFAVQFMANNQSIALDYMERWLQDNSMNYS